MIRNNIISLIGMTGCGKSFIGKLLSQKLGANFIDLDDQIIKTHGNIPAIFSDHGEEHFRELEYSALKEALAFASDRLLVISCGGGLPTYTKSRELLTSNSTVVWLRRSLDKVLEDPSVLERPPINSNIENYVSLYVERYPIFLHTSDYSFYSSTPRRTVAAIIKTLGLK